MRGGRETIITAREEGGTASRLPACCPEDDQHGGCFDLACGSLCAPYLLPIYSLFAPRLPMPRIPMRLGSKSSNPPDEVAAS